MQKMVVNTRSTTLSLHEMISQIQHETSVTQALTHHRFNALESKQQQAEIQRNFFKTLWFENIRCREEQTKDAHRDLSVGFRSERRKKETLDQFAKWLEIGSDPMYWLEGKAGSGKTTLMNFVWQEARTRELLSIWAGTKRLITPAFFCWKPTAKIRRRIPPFAHLSDFGETARCDSYYCSADSSDTRYDW